MKVKLNTILTLKCWYCFFVYYYGFLRVLALFTCTFLERISSCSRWTSALGLMLSADTSGRSCTGILFTDRSAYSIEAITSFVVSTIFIILANTSYARYLGISLCSRWTAALCNVCLDCALSITSTWSGSTGIQTVFIDASFIIWTISVDFTLGCK